MNFKIKNLFFIYPEFCHLYYCLLIFIQIVTSVALPPPSQVPCLSMSQLWWCSSLAQMLTPIQTLALHGKATE